MAGKKPLTQEQVNARMNDWIRGRRAPQTIAQPDPSAPPPIPMGHAGNGTGAALPQPVRRSMNDFLRTAHLQSYINRSFTVR